MVTRKSSLPYPASPPPQGAQPDPLVTASNNLVVDSGDVPPVPNPARNNDFTKRDSGFNESDNPWRDQQSPTHPPVPDFLKPRAGRPAADHKRDNSLTDIPNILRPGNSGQNTPRSSIDSGESRGFWEDDEFVGDAEDHSPERKPGSSGQQVMPQAISEPLPSPSTAIKRKPIGTQNQIPQDMPQPEPSQAFASNNPFRRPSSSSSTPAEPMHAPPAIPDWNLGDPAINNKGKEPVRDPPNQSLSNQFSGLTLSNNQVPDSFADSDPWRVLEPIPAPSRPQAAPPPPPLPEIISPFSSQPPLIPAAQEDGHHNPWSSQPQHAPTPSPIPFDESQKYVTHYNDSLLDRGQQNGVVSLGDELEFVPNVSHPTVLQSQPSLLDEEESGPSLPIRPGKLHREESEIYAPPEGSPPMKPPRPAVATKPLTDVEIARLSEERSETYQIKHFNWFDHGSGRLRRSSMLTQNKNGPCPLLALVNALILGAQDESQAALDDALRTREQVSLGLIIETLMYELVARNGDSGEQLPDVDELNAFLMRLRTGMNANPRFVSQQGPPPNLMDARNSVLHLPQQERNRQKTGTFESTLDMRLYGAFSVPLLHGWLPEVGSDALDAFTRSAQTYEDAQALQFGEEELDYKLSHDGLSPDEQKVWEDINSIKNFLKQYPTQLTPYGLELVQETLSSGSFAIMFRNDHFSTIYKHPQSGQLFTLITDAGYADRDEIIWESLIDISGSHNEFFSGDFMPVSHSDSTASNPIQSQSDHQQLLTVPDTNAPLSPQEQQEQHDADFAMALQLQEEEEQRQRADNARRRRSGNQPTSQNQSSQRPSPRSSQGNIPITLRPVTSRGSDAPENRPLIPPRSARTQVQAVTRPADADNDDAPPAYEEAAKGRPYIPPLGSPLHPSSEPGASPMSSNVQLTGTVSNVSNQGASGGSNSNLQPAHPPGPNAPSYAPRNTNVGSSRPGAGQMPRRMSAYHEQAGSPMASMPGAYNWEGRPVGRVGGPGQGSAKRPGEERCVVM